MIVLSSVDKLAQFEEAFTGPMVPDAPPILEPVEYMSALAPPVGAIPGEPEKISPFYEKQPEDPATMFEEVVAEESPLEQKNREWDVRAKLFHSMTNNSPVRISYTTLPKDDNPAGSTTIRTVIPDYVYWASTGRHVLVAWDYLKSDWRAFAVERIDQASLVETAV